MCTARAYISEVSYTIEGGGCVEEGEVCCKAPEIV